MRVVVTGSRHWEDLTRLRAQLGLVAAEAGGEIEVAHGAASHGADALTDTAAADLRLSEPKRYPVDTSLDGPYPAAPLNRNARMLHDFQPGLVLAFRAAGKSNGTDHCIAYAEGLRIPVRIIRP